MPVATAPERVRLAAAPVRVPLPAHEPRPAVESPGRSGTRWTLGRMAALSGVIILVSLLMVVASSAYLTQGEVRLTKMQQQLTSELGQHRNLLARAARLADPSNVVSQAQRHGLTAPSKVTDLPQVNVSTSSATTSTAPVAGHPSVTSTGGR